MFLVLGSNGLLGSEFSNKYFYNKNFIFLNRDDIDFLDKNLLLEKIKILKPNIIINCCAYSDVNKSEINQELCYATNSELPIYLAEICKKLNIFLIHFSTDYVYDGKSKNSYFENDFTNALNYYGSCKLIADKQIENINGNFCIFRTSWLFSLKNPNNFVFKIISKLKVQNYIKVVDDQFGSPTSTSFLVDVVDLAVQNLDRVNKKIINVSLKGKTSWYLFSKQILHLLTQVDKSYQNKKILPIKSYQLTNSAVRPKNSYLNCDLLKTLMPSVKRISWKKELSNLILDSNL